MISINSDIFYANKNLFKPLFPVYRSDMRKTIDQFFFFNRTKTIVCNVSITDIK